MANTKVTSETRVRTRRSPLEGGRDKLAVANQDPNFVYRWVNDTPGRIDELRERGYEVVTSDVEVGQSKVDRGSKVGSAPVIQAGGGITAVLMRIPREWYNEDLAAKASENDAMEAAMRTRAKQAGDYGSVNITRK